MLKHLGRMRLHRLVVDLSSGDFNKLIAELESETHEHLIIEISDFDDLIKLSEALDKITKPSSLVITYDPPVTKPKG